MKKITEDWLKAAKDDLLVIEKIISDEKLTHMVAFHSQQAIEKSLKSVIEEYEITSVKIHNLIRLLSIISEKIEIDVDLEVIETLDKLYIDARYPADFGLLPDGKPDLHDAKQFRDTAQSIYTYVENKLSNL